MNWKDKHRDSYVRFWFLDNVNWQMDWWQDRQIPTGESTSPSKRRMVLGFRRWVGSGCWSLGGGLGGWGLVWGGWWYFCCCGGCFCGFLFFFFVHSLLSSFWRIRINCTRLCWWLMKTLGRRKRKKCSYMALAHQVTTAKQRRYPKI